MTVRPGWITTLLVAGALGVGGLGWGSAAAAQPPTVVSVQLLNVSDWHGQIDPLNNVGGAAVLSSYFKADRAVNPNTITFTAGDAFGATPPLASFFDEEPAVRTMRLMGFDLDGLGNHNWDKGNAHLQRMIDIARAETGEPGTPFRYLSANLTNLRRNLKHVAPYRIFERGGVKIGFVSVTNPEAPGLVFPGNFGTIAITDPVLAANNARAELNRRGVRTNVLIGHMGVTGFDLQGNPVGPLIDLAKGVTGFDVVAGDHTDVQYSGVIDGKLVYENRSKALTYAKVNLNVDKRSGRALDTSLSFVTPASVGVLPDQAIVDYLAPLRAELATALDGRIGVATDLFPRGGVPSAERSGESALGNLTADSMRSAYGTQLALTNGGGLRASLPSSYVPTAAGLDRTAPAPYDLVIGDVFTVLPFGNQVVTRTVTGAQLWAALENGVSRLALPPAAAADGCAGADGRFPQVSGFRFTLSCGAPAGSRIRSVTVNDGTPIPNDPATSYTFATNDFVNTGGDEYLMFRDGQGVSRDLMANVLQQYIQGLGTITPVIEGRIIKLA